MAFVSLWVQLGGLYGAHGLIPIRDVIFHASLSAGLREMLLHPTLFWFTADDWMLHLICGAATLLSVVTLLGWIRGPGIFLQWMLYLSFCTVGAPFLNFQWDNLLLETGLLASLFISWKSWRPAAPVFHRLAHWLIVYLLFRLMFASGVVKLTSGDPVWASLAALDYHFYTQPLPTPLAWWAHQLPEALLVAATAVMFIVELLVPFCLFLSRRFRLFGAAATILLQVGILLTGNYGFFNLLTIGLCLVLIDDACWTSLLRGGFKRGASVQTGIVEQHWMRKCWHGGVIALAVVILFTSTVQWFGIFRKPAPLQRWWSPVYSMLCSMRSFNSYGLFATMTTSRLELTIEGSDDGTEWRPYRFHWKPNNVGDGLAFVAPHMPRLDWQMWFAALTPPQSRSNYWLERLCQKLLQGNPQVIGLLEENPFPEKPPRWIRVRATDFSFSSWEEKQQSGAVWQEGRSSMYWPPQRLNP